MQEEDAYLLGTKHACNKCKRERAALEVMAVSFGEWL